MSAIAVSSSSDEQTPSGPQLSLQTPPLVPLTAVHTAATLRSVWLTLSRCIAASDAVRPASQLNEESVRALHGASAAGRLMGHTAAPLLQRLQWSPTPLLADAAMLAASVCDDAVLVRLLHLCVLQVGTANNDAAAALALPLLAALKRCQRYRSLRAASLLLTPVLLMQLSMAAAEQRSFGLLLLQSLLLGYSLGPAVWHGSLAACTALLRRIQSDVAVTAADAPLMHTLLRDLEQLRIIMYTCVHMHGAYSFTRDLALEAIEAPVDAPHSSSSVTAVPPPCRPSKATMDALLHVHKWSLETHPPSLACSPTLALCSVPASQSAAAAVPSAPSGGKPPCSTSWFEGNWLCSAAGGSIEWALKYAVTGRRLNGVYQSLARAGAWSLSGHRGPYPRFHPDPPPKAAPHASASSAALVHSLLSPTVVCPRHVPAVYREQQILLRWRHGEFYSARIVGRRLTCYSITAEHFGTRWMEPQQLQGFTPCLGNPLQVNLALSPELASLAPAALAGRRVLALRSVSTGLSNLSGASLANLGKVGEIAREKAFQRGTIVESPGYPSAPSLSLSAAAAPLSPGPTVLVRFDQDGKCIAIAREKVLLYVPIHLANMRKVDNYHNHRREARAAQGSLPLGSGAPASASSPLDADEDAADKPAEGEWSEDSSDEDEGGGAGGAGSGAAQHRNLLHSLSSSAASVNSRDSASPYACGSMEGVLHHDLDGRLVYTCHWRQADQEHPASARLVFHKPACSGPLTPSAASAAERQALAPPTPQSIVFPSSFSGGFVHSELDYGEWIGIRHKYQEQFCLAQPKRKALAKAKARPARGQAPSKHGRRASPPAAAASSSSSSAPAVRAPLYRSAPSSLLYFDGFHTSLRIPGDYALSFPGLAPYTIELCVFVPQREALHADAEADSPLDSFGNSSIGGGGGVGGSAVAGGLLSNTSHAGRQCLFSKSHVSEGCARHTNYSLELNTRDNTLLWTQGYNTFQSTSALHAFRRANVEFDEDGPAQRQVQPPPSAVPWGQWTHICCAFDGRSVRLTINGRVAIAQELHSMGAGAVSEGGVVSPLVVGGLWGPFGHTVSNHFHGFISELRVFNYARAASEVQASMWRPLVGHEPGLLGYWPLHCAFGGLAVDRSGMGLHGSVINCEEKAGERTVRSAQEVHNAREVHRALWAHDDAQRPDASVAATTPLSIASLPWLPAPAAALGHLRMHLHTNVNDDFFLCGLAQLRPEGSSEQRGANGVVQLVAAPTPRSPLCPAARVQHVGGVWCRSKVSVEQGFDCEVLLQARAAGGVAAERSLLPFAAAFQLYAGSLLELAPLSCLRLSGVQMAHSLTFHVRVQPALVRADEIAPPGSDVDSPLRSPSPPSPLSSMCAVELTVFCGNQFGERCRVSSSQHTVESSPVVGRSSSTGDFRFFIRYRPQSRALTVSLGTHDLATMQLDVLGEGLGIGTGNLAFQNVPAAGSTRPAATAQADTEAENERKVYIGVVAELDAGAIVRPLAHSDGVEPAVHSLHLVHWRWFGPSVARASAVPGPSPLPGHATLPSSISASSVERVMLLGALNALLELASSLKGIAHLPNSPTSRKNARAGWLQSCQLLQAQLASESDSAPLLLHNVATMRKQQLRQLRTLVLQFERGLTNPDRPLASVAASNPSSSSLPPLLSAARQAAVNASAAAVDVRESWAAHLKRHCDRASDVIESLSTLLALLPDSFFLPAHKPSALARDTKPEYSVHSTATPASRTNNWYGRDTPTRLRDHLAHLRRMGEPAARAGLVRGLMRAVVEDRCKPGAALLAPFDAFAEAARTPARAHRSSRANPFDDDADDPHSVFASAVSSLSLRGPSIRVTPALRQLWQACSMAARLHGDVHSKCMQSLTSSSSNGGGGGGAASITWETLLAKVRAESFEIISAELSGQSAEEGGASAGGAASVDRALVPLLRARPVFAPSQVRTYSRRTGRLRGVEELPEVPWARDADADDAAEEDDEGQSGEDEEEAAESGRDSEETEDDQTEDDEEEEEEEEEWEQVAGADPAAPRGASPDPPIDVCSASFDTTRGRLYFADLGLFVGSFAVGSYYSVGGKLAGLLHNQQSVAAQQQGDVSDRASGVGVGVVGGGGNDPAPTAAESYQFSFGQWSQNNYRFAYPCTFDFSSNLAKLLGRWNMADMAGEWHGNKFFSGGGNYDSVGAADRGSGAIVPGSAMTQSLNLHQRSRFGYSALLNLGNSCYSNASLISLFVTAELREAVLALPLHMHPARDARVPRTQKRLRQEQDARDKRAREDALAKSGSAGGGGGADDDAAAFAVDDDIYGSLDSGLVGSGVGGASGSGAVVDKTDAARRELKLISALQLVFSSLAWSSRSFLDLTYFQNALKFPFCSKQQQDSLQFVQYLLETLANPILLAPAPVQARGQGDAKTPSSSAGADELSVGSLSLSAAASSSSSSISGSSAPPSITSSLFGGQICTRYECTACGFARENLEAFSDLAVSFPKSWSAITDVAVVSSARLGGLAPPPGYERVGLNLWQGIKGAGYAYLCVRREPPPRLPVTAVALVHGPSEAECFQRVPAGFVRLPFNLNPHSSAREYSHVYLCVRREAAGSPLTQLDLIAWFRGDGRSVQVPDGFIRLELDLHAGVNHAIGVQAAAAVSVVATSSSTATAPTSPHIAATSSSSAPPPPPPPSTRALYLAYKQGCMLRDVVVVTAPTLPAARARTPPGYTLIECDFNLEAGRGSNPHGHGHGLGHGHGRDPAPAPDAAYIAYTSGGDQVPITSLSVHPMADSAERMSPSSPLEQVRYYSLGACHYAMVIRRGEGSPIYAPEVFRAPVAPRKYGGFETLDLHPAASSGAHALAFAGDSSAPAGANKAGQAASRDHHPWHLQEWRSADGERIVFEPPRRPSAALAEAAADGAASGLPVPDEEGDFDCWVVEGKYSNEGFMRGVLYYDPAWTGPAGMIVPAAPHRAAPTVVFPPGAAPSPRWVMQGSWRQKDSLLPQSMHFVFDEHFASFNGCWQNGESEGSWTGVKLPDVFDDLGAVDADAPSARSSDTEVPSDSDDDAAAGDEHKQSGGGGRSSSAVSSLRRTRSSSTRHSRMRSTKVWAATSAPRALPVLEQGPIVSIFGVLHSQMAQLQAVPNLRRTVLLRTGVDDLSANLKPIRAQTSLFLGFERAPLPATPELAAAYAGPQPIVDVQIVWAEVEPVPEGYEVARMWPPAAASSSAAPGDATAGADAASSATAATAPEEELNTNVDSDGPRILICFKRAATASDWSKQPLLYDLKLLREAERAPAAFTKLMATPCGLESDLNAQSSDKPHVMHLATRMHAYVPAQLPTTAAAAVTAGTDGTAVDVELGDGDATTPGGAVDAAGSDSAATPAAAAAVVPAAPRAPLSPVDGFEGRYETGSGEWVTKIVYAGRGRRVSAQLHGTPASHTSVMAAGGRIEGIMVKRTFAPAAASAAVADAAPPCSYHLFAQLYPALTAPSSTSLEPRLLDATRHRNKYPSTLDLDMDREGARLTGKLTWWKVTVTPPPAPAPATAVAGSSFISPSLLPPANHNPNPNAHITATLTQLSWNFVRDSYASLSFLRNTREQYVAGAPRFSDAAHALTLQSMLRSYFASEMMAGVKCSSVQCAGRPTTTQRSAALTGEPPRFLILTAKRFGYDLQLHKSNKIIQQLSEMSHIVRLPLIDSEKSGTAAAADDGGPSSSAVPAPAVVRRVGEVEYGLYAIIVHAGASLDGGHYLNYVRSSNENLRYADRVAVAAAADDAAADRPATPPSAPHWLCFNDHAIAPSSWAEMCNKFKESLFDTPYCFFLRRLEPEGRDPVVPGAELAVDAAHSPASADASVVVVTSDARPTLPKLESRRGSRAGSLSADPSTAAAITAAAAAAAAATPPVLVASAASAATAPLPVCPGLAEAIATDNLTFFQDELAFPVGQTQQQQQQQPRASQSHGSGGSSVEPLLPTPAAFFLHKIQAEVRRKHSFTMAWGEEDSSEGDDDEEEESVATSPAAAAAAEQIEAPRSRSGSGSGPSSAASSATPAPASVCDVCYVPLPHPSHGSDGCPHACLTTVECPHCCASMTAAQLAAHVQPAGVLLAQYEPLATASKIALPQDLLSNPDQLLCANDFFVRHFAQFNFPYPSSRWPLAPVSASESMGLASRAHSTRRGSGGGGGAIVPLDRVPSGAATAASFSSWAKAGTAGDALISLASSTGADQHGTALSRSTPSRRNSGAAAVTAAVGDLHLADRLPSASLGARSTSENGGRGGRHTPTISDLPLLPDAAAPLPGEEFPPNCEACGQRLLSFHSFLSHMASCPALA